MISKLKIIFPIVVFSQFICLFQACNGMSAEEATLRAEIEAISANCSVLEVKQTELLDIVEYYKSKLLERSKEYDFLLADMEQYKKQHQVETWALSVGKEGYNEMVDNNLSEDDRKWGGIKLLGASYYAMTHEKEINDYREHLFLANNQLENMHEGIQETKLHFENALTELKQVQDTLVSKKDLLKVKQLALEYLK